jgi:hypothetical protein
MPKRKVDLNELRKKMQKASELKGKKAGSSFASRGMRGTKFALGQVMALKKISSKKGPNQELAEKILKIFEKTREGTITPDIDSPSSDHQILVNISRKTLIAEKQEKKAELNPRQKKVLERYEKYI